MAVKITASKVRTALRALGDSPGAIAKSLRKKGIKGTPLDACKCPLALYLSQATGFHAVVGDVEGSVSRIEIYPGEGHNIPLVVLQGSKVAQKFVEKFDTGSYPFLVAEG